MYIKVVKKNDKKYYILSVCDASSTKWSNHFIDVKIANALYSVGVKFIEK